MKALKKLEIRLPGKFYPILVGEGALTQCAGEIAGRVPDGRAAVVSDETVWALHGPLLEDALREKGIKTVRVLVPPGEGSKSLEALAGLYKEFARSGLRRSDPVIAFGGGVVGDLAGFAASTYMRGVPLIQVPTTLLSQVDSSVGGKVAINLEEGKNLVGSFYQPQLVVADTGLLSTLPEREWKAGMAEVVKYAAIGEKSLPELLADPRKTRERLERIVYLCCRCKARYVKNDERDTGRRMVLNFGHTFAHALERYHAYGKYCHGEAVAIGMALALRTGVLLGVTESEAEAQLTGLMLANGLSITPEEPMEELASLMTGDKKNSGDSITLVLLEGIGRPVLRRIGRSELTELLKGDSLWRT